MSVRHSGARLRNGCVRERLSNTLSDMQRSRYLRERTGGRLRRRPDVRFHDRVQIDVQLGDRLCRRLLLLLGNLRREEDRWNGMRRSDRVLHGKLSRRRVLSRRMHPKLPRLRSLRHWRRERDLRR